MKELLQAGLKLTTLHTLTDMSQYTDLAGTEISSVVGAVHVRDLLLERYHRLQWDSMALEYVVVD